MGPSVPASFDTHNTCSSSSEHHREVDPELGQCCGPQQQKHQSQSEESNQKDASVAKQTVQGHPLERQKTSPEEYSSSSSSSSRQLSSCDCWGLAYWCREAKTAKEHGGDFQKRLDGALRDALGSLILFCVVVFPPGAMEVLKVVWLGNIFMHVCVMDSLGSSLLMVQGFGFSVLLITLVAWPTSLLLMAIKSRFSETVAEALFPFVTFIMTFGTMSCPQLMARNAVVVIFWIIAGSSVLEDQPWYEPLLVIVVLYIGVAIGPLVNILPYPRLAIHATQQLSANLQHDLGMFLTQCKIHNNDDSKDKATSTRQAAPLPPNAAKASIEILYDRIVQTIASLKTKLPATRLEMKLLRRLGNTTNHRHQEAPEALERWIAQMEKLQPHLQCLQNALTKPIVEMETFAPHTNSNTLSSYGEKVQNVPTEAQNKVLDAMKASIAVLAASDSTGEDTTKRAKALAELEERLLECQVIFRRAMIFAATNNEKLLEDRNQKLMVFAHLTNQMGAFHAMLELGDCLVDFLKDDHQVDTTTKHSTKSFWTTTLASFSQWANQSWLWNKKETFRVAIKTAVGMGIASLFVSVPYLKEVASPHELWPGNTIASVNLATTGSSFHKASDRLFGTLLAGAFALLVADFIPGSPETQDWIKVITIVAFTFVMIYLKDPNHAYLYTYAANSIGTMLYGSVDVGYDVQGYIPKRIELIFVGVLIFTAVELLLFVRSSREVVEQKGLSIFLSLSDFLDQALVSTKELERHVNNESTPASELTDSAVFDLTHQTDPFQIKKLCDQLSSLKSEMAEFKKEVKPGLQEPLLGFSLPLHAPSFNGLTLEHQACITYGTLLIQNMKSTTQHLILAESNPSSHIKDWSILQTALISEEFQKAAACCRQLQSAFPDSRLRPQKENSVEAITAAASFRGFGGDTLNAFAKWSDIICSRLMVLGSEDARTVMTLGMTTAYFLSFCHHIELAGAHLEGIVHNFPRPSEGTTKDL